MKICLIDSKAEEVRRNWSGMLGQTCEIAVTTAKEVTFWSGLEGPTIVVVHNYRTIFPSVQKWREVSEAIGPNKVWVICVSGDGYGDRENFGKNVYARVAPVASAPGALDRHFSLGFNAFKEDIERQYQDKDAIISPNFSLLEPPAAPEALLSLYLCDVAGMDLDEKQEARLLERAELEFNTLVDHEHLKTGDKQAWEGVLEDRTTGIGTLLKELERKL